MRAQQQSSEGQQCLTQVTIRLRRTETPRSAISQQNTSMSIGIGISFRIRISISFSVDVNVAVQIQVSANTITGHEY